MRYSMIITVLACFFFNNTGAQKLELLKDEAGRPEYSPDGSKIAYHAKMPDGYYDVFIMDSNGENEECLTCGLTGTPQKHIGQPSWHPSGKWITFQAEKEEHVLPKVGALAVPGIGYHNDVYVIELESKSITRLTNLETKERVGDKTPTCAILQPHFSPSGNSISWSERYEDGGDWGRWKIVTASFIISDDGTVSISDVKEFTPGVNDGYYESNDYFCSDTSLLICGNLEPDQTELGIDIYHLNLIDSTTKRLTHTMDYFDECPHPNHACDQICFLSTEGFENEDNKKWWWAWARGEFWLMNPDGTNKRQITFFNSPDHEHYTGFRTIPAYISWSPDDSTILLAVAVEYKKRKIKDQIYRLTLED